MFRFQLLARLSIIAAICTVGTTAVSPLSLRSTEPSSVHAGIKTRGHLGFVPLPLAASSTRLDITSCSQRCRRPAVAGMNMRSSTHLVTYGDVFRESYEEESRCDAIWEASESEEEGAVNPLALAASACCSVATGVWDHLTAEPNPEEVQANMAAFAKAHGGAIMTPLSEMELEKQVRYYGMFPDLVDTMIETELTSEVAENSAA
mmetsp:Transcript_19679/g.40092  ORF Transcript_19679/g.40092 Transcript_19679/m.40092 type:complete len:205 (+) Transcript_19679:102-716(+)|eukprot:CAMPEP_0181300196 /NCGR_PEP_ID=MMETSP1101-20121128/6759_1 /TAXON_ID=46948 /ORGANISM="Rhodomonas abbreviata, Strain Caron Lab Isolate" /LENGTH=204 /DNA_ID=CAMNT_0023405413 /DNA_START=98 /DNA_END=712 /DNA_ORIENTATION=+